MARKLGAGLVFVWFCLTGCASTMQGAAGMATPAAGSQEQAGSSDLIWWNGYSAPSDTLWFSAVTPPSESIWWSEATPTPSSTLWWDSNPAASPSPVVATPTQ